MPATDIYGNPITDIYGNPVEPDFDPDQAAQATAPAPTAGEVISTDPMAGSVRGWLRSTGQQPQTQGDEQVISTDPGAGASSQVGNSRANILNRALMDQGWSPTARAGLLGDSEQESSFNPVDSSDGGTSRGLFQVDPKLFDPFDRQMQARGIKPTDPRYAYAQAQYVMNRYRELHPDRAYAMNNARSGAEAGEIFRSTKHWGVGIWGKRSQYSDKYERAIRIGPETGVTIPEPPAQPALIPPPQATGVISTDPMAGQNWRAAAGAPSLPQQVVSPAAAAAAPAPAVDLTQYGGPSGAELDEIAARAMAKPDVFIGEPGTISGSGGPSRGLTPGGPGGAITVAGQYVPPDQAAAAQAVLGGLGNLQFVQQNLLDPITRVGEYKAGLQDWTTGAGQIDYSASQVEPPEPEGEWFAPFQEVLGEIWHGGTRKTAEVGLSYLAPMWIARASLPKEHPVRQFTEGLTEGGGALAETLTHEDNLALIAVLGPLAGASGIAGLAGRGASAWFSYEMASHAPELWHAFKEAPDLKTKTAIATQGLGTLGLAFAAGKHAIKPFPVKGAVDQFGRPLKPPRGPLPPMEGYPWEREQVRAKPTSGEIQTVLDMFEQKLGPREGRAIPPEEQVVLDALQEALEREGGPLFPEQVEGTETTARFTKEVPGAPAVGPKWERPPPLDVKERRNLEGRAQAVVDAIEDPIERGHAQERLNEITKFHQEVRGDLLDAKTTGDKLRAEMEMVELENDLRRFAGEPEVVDRPPITAEDIRKDQEWQARRVQEIQGKLDRGEPIDKFDRQDWRIAGQDPDKLPKEEAPPPPKKEAPAPEDAERKLYEDAANLQRDFLAAAEAGDQAKVAQIQEKQNRVGAQIQAIQAKRQAEYEAKIAAKGKPGEEGVWYHGTLSGADISKEGFKPEFQKEDSLAGPGFYFTDAPGIASEYPEAGMFVSPQNLPRSVVAVRVDVKKPFEFEKTYSWEQAAGIAEEAGRPDVAEKIRADAKFTKEWGEKEKVKVVTGLKGEELYKRLTTGDEKTRITKTKVNQTLQGMGFDGITYQGGKVMGGPSHNVLVAFKPEQVKFRYGAEPPKPDRLAGIELKATRDVVIDPQDLLRVPGLEPTGKFLDTGTLPTDIADLKAIARTLGWRIGGSRPELTKRLVHHWKEMRTLANANPATLADLTAGELKTRLRDLDLSSSYGNRTVNAQRLVAWATTSLRNYEAAATKILHGEAIKKALAEKRPIGIGAAIDFNIRQALEERGYVENPQSGLYEFQGKPDWLRFDGKKFARPHLERLLREAEESLAGQRKGLNEWEQRYETALEQERNPPTDPSTFIYNKDVTFKGRQDATAAVEKAEIRVDQLQKALTGEPTQLVNFDVVSRVNPNWGPIEELRSVAIKALGVKDWANPQNFKAETSARIQAKMLEIAQDHPRFNELFEQRDGRWWHKKTGMPILGPREASKEGWETGMPPGEGAAGPAEDRYEVVQEYIDQSGRPHPGITVYDGSRTAPNGLIEAELNAAGELQVRHVVIYPHLKGTGRGVALYERLIQEAGERRVVSDDSVSESAAKIWEALARRGYAVEKNPVAKLADRIGAGEKHWQTADMTPVFRITEIRADPIELNQLSQAKFGKDYDKLTPGEQDVIDADWRYGTEPNVFTFDQPATKEQQTRDLQSAAAMATRQAQGAPVRWKLVGCGKAKRDEIVSAQDLYIGSLSKARIDNAEGSGLPWLVVSAKHGLVAPKTPLAPYDVSVGDLTPKDIAAWKHQFAVQLERILKDQKPSTVTFELHMGKEYRALVEPILKKIGVKIETPVEGKGIGQQIQHYKKLEPVPFTTPHPRGMSHAAVNQELDKLDRSIVELSKQLTAAGRGSELPSAIATQTDPLSRHFTQVNDRIRELEAEVDRRAGRKMSLHRLPVGRYKGRTPVDLIPPEKNPTEPRMTREPPPPIMKPSTLPSEQVVKTDPIPGPVAIESTEGPVTINENVIPAEGGRGLAEQAAAEPTMPETSTMPADATAPIWVRTDQVAIRPKLMQFKDLDNEATGTAREAELSGRYDPFKAGLSLLWEPLPENRVNYGLTGDAKYIMVNGHYREAFRRKQNVPGHYAQILREADGVSANDARRAGAWANIADGKGTIYDQARFIRSQAESGGADAAVDRARQIGARSRKAETIAINAEADLYDSFINQQISPEQAAAIAEAAPKNAGLQRLGIKKAKEGMTPAELDDFLQATQANMGTDTPQPSQVDMFGENDAAMQQSALHAKRAGALRREIGDSIAAVSGAVKRPEKAAAMGVNIRDKAAVQAKLKQLVDLRERARRWSTDAEIRSVIQKTDLSPEDSVKRLTGMQGEQPTRTMKSEPPKPDTPTEDVEPVKSVSGQRPNENGVYDENDPAVETISFTGAKRRGRALSSAKVQVLPLEDGSWAGRSEYNHLQGSYSGYGGPLVKQFRDRGEALVYHLKIIKESNERLLARDDTSVPQKVEANKIIQWANAEFAKLPAQDLATIAPDEFSFEPMESDAELRERIDREAKQKKENDAKKEAEAKLQHGWEQKLDGNTGDLGQQRLKGAEEDQPELFSGPPSLTGEELPKERQGPPLPSEDPNFTALPVDLPEAVRFATELLHTAISVKKQLKALGGQAAGVFRRLAGDKAEILLRADIADLLSRADKARLLEEAQTYAEGIGGTAREQAQIAKSRYEFLLDQAYEEAKRHPSLMALKVIWHEIGHAVDWWRHRAEIPGVTPFEVEGRGNIFGHIAALNDYLRNVISLDPNLPMGKPLTPKETRKLRKEAKKQMQQQIGPMQEIIETIMVEEPDLRIRGITPQDVKNIINTNTARTDTPELYKWFAEQPAAIQKEIIRAAMRGMLDPRLEALGETEVVGVRRVERTVRRTVGREPTEAEVQERFAKLFEEELRRRNLAELKTVKKELEGAIAWWHGQEEMPAYFSSPEEMYAEAFSIFMNNPQALAKRAPTYTRLLWNYMDHRLEVSEIYDKIQNEIKAGVVEDNTETAILDSWDRGNKQALKEAQEKARFSRGSRQDMLDKVQYHIDRRFGPSYTVAKGAPSEGELRAAIGNFLYRTSEHELILNRRNNQVGKLLVEHGLDDKWYGLYKFYNRVAHERFKIFNPYGTTPQRALKRLEKMQQNLGARRWAALEQAAANWRKIYMERVGTPMIEERMWTPELNKQIDENVYWSAFDVRQTEKGPEDGIDRLLTLNYGPEVKAHIYHQVGTVKEIMNPAFAEVLKALNLTSMTARNAVKRNIVQVHLENDRGNIKEAGKEWTGKYWKPKIIENEQIGTIVYMRDGKPQAYYVRRVVADSVNKGNTIENPLMLMAVRATGGMKSVYTQLNYGFWPVNFLRDTWGWIHQLPGATPASWLYEFPKAFKGAADITWGRPNPAAERALEQRVIISRGDPRGIWSAAENLHEVKLASFGIKPAAWSHVDREISPLVSLWNSYREFGQIIERTNKLAAFNYMERKFPSMPEWQRNEIVRERGGSPDFLQRGAANPAIDFFFAMFYNPWKEGLRSVTRAARENPFSFAAKAVAFVSMPTMAQVLAASGAFGQNKKEQYRSIPDYDLSNYLCVPFGWADRSQNKVAYFRFPLWEPARILHMMIWQFMTGRGKGYGALYGGTLPTANSLLTTFAMWGQHQIFGKNPYDTFRGRYVLDDKTFQAGGWEARKELLKQSWNNLGGAVAYRFLNQNLDNPPTTGIEKFLHLPGVSNLVGRWLKVSNQGREDQAFQATKEYKKYQGQVQIAVQEIERKIIAKEAFTQAEKRLLHDPYAMQYLADTLAQHMLSAKSPLFRALEGKSNVEKMLIMQELKRFSQEQAVPALPEQ